MNARAHPLRAAIVGCGRTDAARNLYGVAARHAGAYLRCPATEVVAICDANWEHLQTFGEEYCVRQRYTSFTEMLEREQPDLVSVCTWPGLHAAMTVAAAAAGAQGVWCESPMAVDLPDCDAMLQACERSGTVLVVNHQWRLSPRARQLRQRIAGGEIGAPLEVAVHLGVGAALDPGTHWFDLGHYLLGEPEVRWVLAQLAGVRGRHAGQPPEEGFVIAGFAGGARLHMTLGLDHPTGPACVVRGRDGLIEFDDGKDARVLSPAGVWVLPPAAGADPFDAALEDLLAALDSGQPPELSGERGRSANALLRAALDASRLGARVMLDRAPSSHEKPG